MPTKTLPSAPSLEHLKSQAKDLAKARVAHNPEAAQRIREFHPRFHAASDAAISSAAFSLSDAQLTISREYGFASWARLRAQVSAGNSERTHLPIHERIEDPVFRQAVDLLDAGDEAALLKLLRDHPKLTSERMNFEGMNYFRNPSLLEFCAENPIRHRSLPPNIVKIAKLILEAGAKADESAVSSTLGLVCSGCVARECGVQISLIDLLCEYGADPDSAMVAALGHGEFEAVEALLRHGAKLTLPLAAATGRVADAGELLGNATAEERHLALAYAAQFGKAEIAKLLLESGEDPNRYNPVGAHSHSTPLHQGALYGHIEVVRLLIAHGANKDAKDILYQGTPLGWAEHGGQTAVAEFLRSID